MLNLYTELLERKHTIVIEYLFFVSPAKYVMLLVLTAGSEWGNQIKKPGRTFHEIPVV